MDSQIGEVTRLLGDLRAGKKDAEAQLFSLVYNELRRMARNYLRKERRDHTLQPTALVHEVYLKLIEQPNQNWENRIHFLSIGARLMKQILVDHARKHHAAKRGGRDKPVTLDESMLPVIKSPEELLILDEALSKLEAFDPRKSR